MLLCREGSEQIFPYRNTIEKAMPGGGCRSRGTALPHTVGGEQEIRRVLLGQPSDLIDLLLNLQALQVIELWLVALEGAVDIVLSPAVGLVLALQRDREELKVLAAGSGCSGW